jgi:multicomponent Na+:H+ antiporter subunit G
MSVTSILSAALIWTGAGLILLAGVGVLRFPDVLTRTSAATKATGLGLAAILAGVALAVGTPRAFTVLGLAVLIQLLTSPVSGHVLGRAAYRSGAPLWEGTHTDDLEEHYRARGDSDGHS